MKMKIFTVVALSVACIQSAVAAGLFITNNGDVPMQVMAYSNGFKNGVEKRIINPGTMSTQFKSGKHRITAISFQPYDDKRNMTYGRKATSKVTIPATNEASHIVIGNTDNVVRYNLGSGWKDIDVVFE